MRRSIPQIESLEDRLLLAASVFPLAAPSADDQTAAATRLIGLDRLRADPRFAGIDGSGQTVVIIDTGIEASHPFFGNSLVYQWDYLENDAVANDTSGHGTHVASLIASRDAVYPGVAPGANLIVLRAFDGEGNGTFEDIEKGLQWVLAHLTEYRIAAVNLSFGDDLQHRRGTRLYGIDDELAALAARDVTIVSSAGNAYAPGVSVGLSYPAADPSVLPVGSVYAADGRTGYDWSSGARDVTTGPDRIASFSQRAAGAGELFAPGMFLAGAWLDGDVADLSGTSMATAVVSGVVALAQQLARRELGRSLTSNEMRSLLSSSGVSIRDGDDENDNVSNTKAEYRRIDAYALAESILRQTPNHAPTLSGPGQLLDLLEDTAASSGSNVFTVVGSTLRDVDRSAKRGIAVTGLQGQGRWQYSLDGGRSWRDMGTVGLSAALLLRDTDKVRFVPAANWNGPIAINYLGWDQNSGRVGEVVDLSKPGTTGGITSFSATSSIARANVLPVNDAPVVTGAGRFGSPPLSESGSRVLDLLGSTFRDADTGARLGIAIVGTTGAGRWQYSFDEGQTWNDLGTVSANQARILGEMTRIRFVPTPGWVGTARLSYRAWDQTSGVAGSVVDLSSWLRVGGQTAFSKEIGTADWVVVKLVQAGTRLLVGSSRPAGMTTNVATASATEPLLLASYAVPKKERVGG